MDSLEIANEGVNHWTGIYAVLHPLLSLFCLVMENDHYNARKSEIKKETNESCSTLKVKIKT